MDRQDEALRVAEELLADIELQRLKASEIVLKASRLARFIVKPRCVALITTRSMFTVTSTPTPGSADQGYWPERTTGS